MKVLKKDEESVNVNLNPKNQYIPKIVVCPTVETLEIVKAEFISFLGIKALGLCLITIDEAIEAKLPLRKAQEDFDNKIANDIYITTKTDELIPSDYLDLEEVFDVKKAVNFFAKKEEEEENKIKRDTGRNDLCLCGSKKKYKNCCLNKG
jgi:hypothetical protein